LTKYFQYTVSRLSSVAEPREQPKNNLFSFLPAE